MKPCCWLQPTKDFLFLFHSHTYTYTHPDGNRWLDRESNVRGVGGTWGVDKNKRRIESKRSLKLCTA